MDSTHETPSPWIMRHLHLIPRREQQPVLDLACGRGRHVRALLQAGFYVEAVDHDVQTLQALQDTNLDLDLDFTRLHWRCHDLEQDAWPYPEHSFDGIIVTRYLHRPLLPYLVSALAPQGILIYETFLQGQETLGRPRNPDFLLAPQELLRFALENKLRVLAYEEGCFSEPAAAMLARLVACKTETHS